jgi:hypothetical protein
MRTTLDIPFGEPTPCCAASSFLAACRSWVIKRPKNMSATAAAFAGSSRGDRINAAAPCDTLELAKMCSQCS